MERNENILAALAAATADPASPLHFAPVRLRVRRDGWTAERQRRYVAALALTGRSDKAAASVGMSVQSAARLTHRPDGEPFFRACCAAVTLAKRARSARAAQGSEGSEGSSGFAPWQAAPTTPDEPSAPRPNLSRLFGRPRPR